MIRILEHLLYIISVVPRSRFLGDLNFRGTFTNSGGHTKFLPVKLNSFLEISHYFLFKFELGVDSFGSRRGVDDSELVSAIALVLNSPANVLFFYIKKAFSGLLL